MGTRTTAARTRPQGAHRRRPVGHILAGAGAAALAALLMACGDGGGKAPAGRTLSPGSAPTSAEGSRVVAFEDTFAYPDGLKVKVSRPEPFTPSDTSLGHKADHEPVTFSVTLTNGTRKSFDVAGMLVMVKAGEKGARAEQVFDTARGVGTPFTGALAPGAAGATTFAFDVPKDAKGRLDVEVRPDFGAAYPGVHWVGAAR
ncbi:hypothetical protein ABZ951_13945 [Streptomyces sp. NPDC046215]